MYQSPAGRLCSALRDVPALCASSLRQQTHHSPVKRRALSPPVLGSLASFGCCHSLAGWIGDGPAKAASNPATASPPVPTGGATGTPSRSASRSVCSMGNRTSRLYSALAKTLSSTAAISQHQDYLEESEHEQLDPLDPKDLLEECQVALRERPARLHREFVSRTEDFSGAHTFRVMQWNILAQGAKATLSDTDDDSSNHSGLPTFRRTGHSEQHKLRILERNITLTCRMIG